MNEGARLTQALLNYPACARLLQHEVSAITRLAGGRSNPTYLLESGAERFVLRTRPNVVLAKSAHRIDREWRVLRALDGIDLPTPKVLHVCEDPSILGKPFYVMEWLHGASIENPAMEGLTCDARRTYYVSATLSLAQLHQLDVETLGLSDFGKPDGYVARQVAGFADQMQTTRRWSSPSLDKLASILARLAPAQRRTSLVHGDYRFGNLKCDSQGQTAAILDWELSTLGDPFADLAYFLLCFRLEANRKISPGIIGLNLFELGIPTEETLLGLYCEAGNTNVPEAWPIYSAHALFRMAVICHGVFVRNEQDDSGTYSAERAQEVERLAEIGLSLL